MASRVYEGPENDLQGFVHPGEGATAETGFTPIGVIEWWLDTWGALFSSDYNALPNSNPTPKQSENPRERGVLF